MKTIKKSPTRIAEVRESPGQREFSKFMANEIAGYADVIKAANVHFD